MGAPALCRGQGPKWRLAWRFTLLGEEWARYRQSYRSIMVADDDLMVSAGRGWVLGGTPVVGEKAAGDGLVPGACLDAGACS